MSNSIQLSLNSLLELIKWPVFLEHVFYTSTDRAINSLILMIIAPVQTHVFPEDQSVFLGAFKKLRNEINSFVMPACLSVRMEQFGSQRDGLYKFFHKSVEKN